MELSILKSELLNIVNSGDERMSMYDLQEPKPNYWYINRIGKLIKVRMVLHGVEGIETVLIQYAEGTMHCISIDDWNCLDLVAPNYAETDTALENDSTL